MKHRTRRRYVPIIHRTYQYRFLTFTMTYTLIVVFFMAGFIFVPEFMQMTDPHASFEVQVVAADKILYGHAKMWPFLVALLLLIALHSLRVFARFVGPLYQFTRAFEKIAGGDLSFHVKIRKGDYLGDERDGFNEMIDSLSGRIDRMRLVKDEMFWTLDRMEKAAPAPDPRLAELRSRVEKLDAVLSAFTLHSPEEPRTQPPAESAPDNRL